MTLTRIADVLRRLWPAILAATLVLGSLLGHGMDDGPMGFVAMVLAATGLALARSKPLWALAPAALGALLGSGLQSTGWFPLLIAFATAMLAAYSAASLRVSALIGVPVAIVAAFIIGSWDLAVDSSFVTWICAMVIWGAAFGVRAARDALRAEGAKEQAVARTGVVERELRDERLRADLTHDFHDVMAHSLAVLAAQAEGLRLTHEAHPERIAPVLTTISDTARLALVEVRQLLERVDDDARRPQPTSADIPGLVAQTRSAGPDVQLLDIGTRGHLGRIADIAAYRIVQESLTNALRHGGADVDIVVALTWTGPGLTLGVSSPIGDREALRPPGRGIAGMHERVRLAGGTLEIDAEGERFVVSAHLPYEPVSAEPTLPLTEDQLATLPVPQQRPPARPEEVVAPWIVEATRLQAEHRAASDQAAPTDWSQATTVELGTGDRRPGLASALGSRDGQQWPSPSAPPRIRNPMAPQ